VENFRSRSSFLFLEEKTRQVVEGRKERKKDGGEGAEGVNPVPTDTFQRTQETHRKKEKKQVTVFHPIPSHPSPAQPSPAADPSQNRDTISKCPRPEALK